MTIVLDLCVVGNVLQCVPHARRREYIGSGIIKQLYVLVCHFYRILIIIGAQSIFSWPTKMIWIYFYIIEAQFLQYCQHILFFWLSLPYYPFSSENIPGVNVPHMEIIQWSKNRGKQNYEYHHSASLEK